MQVVHAAVLGQVVGDSVDGEGAVGDAVGHSADGAAEVGVVVDEVVVDVVEAERHVAEVSVLVRNLALVRYFSFLDPDYLDLLQSLTAAKYVGNQEPYPSVLCILHNI